MTRRSAPGSALAALTAFAAPVLASLLCIASVAGQTSDESAQARAERLAESAREIHAKILTLDTHKDISASLATESSSEVEEEIEAYRRRCDPTVDGDNQVDFPKMRAGGYDCAFYIVYVGQAGVDGAGFVQAKREAFLKFAAIQRMVDKFPEHIGLARTPADVRRLHRDGRLIACIGIENGYPMGENLALIENFHRRGARYMSITHNRHNQLGDSHTPPEPLHGGLTELGRKAVAEMNRVGIMIDISHASKATMMEVLDRTRAPVIASHSGCRAVFDHSRNLDDEQLRALRDNGGVIQIVALGDFLRDQESRRTALAELRKELGLPSRWALWTMQNEGEGLTPELVAKLEQFEKLRTAIDTHHPKTSLSDFADHIEHAVQVCGIDHVGIGSDFDGGGGIRGWKDASESPNVTAELLRRGLTAADIEKIWSGNLLRVWGEVERIAQEPRVEPAPRRG